MSLSSYIVPRGIKGTLQLRVPVPRQLWIMLGKQSYRRSLGTTDRTIAHRIATPILVRWQSEFSHLISVQAPEVINAAEVALRRVYRPLIEQYNQSAALALAAGHVGTIVQTAQARVARRVLENSSGKLNLNRLADLLIAGAIADEARSRKLC